MSDGFDPEVYRGEFPVTETWTYLNHAALGPYPTRTADAIAAFARAWSNPAEFDQEGNERVLSETKTWLAELAGGSADHVAFVGSLAEGMNLLGNGLEWKPGDNLIIPGHEFPSVVYPFLNLERLGVEVRFVGRNDEGRTDIGMIEQLIDERTRVVAVSHVEWLDGYRNDLVALGELCASHGVELFVDATQSLAAQHIDLEKTKVTAIAAHGYKWLLGGFGAGVVIFNKGAMERIYPTYVGRVSIDMDMNDTSWQLKLKNTAEKYQTGGLNMQSITGLHASLSMLRDVTVEKSQAWTREIGDHLADGLTEMGYRVISDRSAEHASQIVTFSHQDDSQNDTIIDFLLDHQVSVVGRGGCIRVSPYFYNTHEEIDRLLEHLPRA